jgi:hypothetical protein
LKRPPRSPFRQFRIRNIEGVQESLTGGLLRHLYQLCRSIWFPSVLIVEKVPFSGMIMPPAIAIQFRQKFTIPRISQVERANRKVPWECIAFNLDNKVFNVNLC